MPFILTSHLVLELLFEGGHLTCVLLLLSLHLISMMHILLFCLLDTPLFGSRSLLVHSLDLILKLLDLCNEAVLILFLQRSILIDPLCNSCNLILELFTCGLAIPQKLLILGNILLQIIKYLQLFIQGNQRV